MRMMKPLYIFHWDTDGIASAALLKKYVDPDPKLYTPLIGLYTLKYVRSDICKNVDWVNIIDFGVSNADIKSFMYRCGLKMIVIDHHYRPADDELDIIDFKLGGELYPSTTLLISDRLELKYDLLTVLGIVGDFGEKIYYSKYLDIVEDVSKRYDLSVDDIIRLSSLIDSNYISMNRKSVVRAVNILVRYSDVPLKLLNYSKWVRQCNEIMSEIETILSRKPIVLDNIRLLEFDSKFFITSVIGRNLSMRYKGSFIVIGRPNLYKGFSQIYIRIYPKPSKTFFFSIIRELNEMGFLAGGKEDVVGVIVQNRKYKELLRLIINKLKGV
jgi:hypothetical protein